MVSQNDRYKTKANLSSGYKLKTIDRGAQVVIGTSALGAIGLLYV